jgi:COMPASS component SWD2
MHPGADTFITTGEDDAVYLWNVSTPQWVGRLDIQKPTLSAWDPSGRVFAVAVPGSATVLLFDNRNFERGPFQEMDVLKHTRADSGCANAGWSKLEFSNDGKSVLLGTRGLNHYIFDAFDGHLRSTLSRNAETNGVSSRLAPGDGATGDGKWEPGARKFYSGGDVAFTPDGRFVVGGARRSVLVWDTLSYVPVDKRLEPAHVLEDAREAAVLAFNPRFNFFATADEDLVFWMPDTYQ